MSVGKIMGVLDFLNEGVRAARKEGPEPYRLKNNNARTRFILEAKSSHKGLKGSEGLPRHREERIP